MARRVRPHLTLLALLTVTGLLSAGEGLRPLPHDMLAFIRGQQSQRVAQLTRSLEGDKTTLGLGMLDGLQAFNQVTDAFGQTHVRCHQTFRGVEVYNGIVLGHMDATGRMLPPHATVQKDISLDSVALLDESKIREIVTRNLPQEGKLWPLQVKRLVFPTKYQDGIKMKRDASGRFVVDPVYSVGTSKKTDPYRWAFQISAIQAKTHGFAVTEFIIDGQTGEILKKWDGVHYADTPAVGTGTSQYNGTVSLNTVQLTDSSNQFILRDTTRATKPHPWSIAPPEGLPLPEYGGIGFQTVCYDNYNSTNNSGTMPFTNASNTWGDGQPFDWENEWPDRLYDAHGQTAAVDAHYALQMTWDYYKNVLGRDGGIDGQGTSPVSIVHMDDGMGAGRVLNNAAWIPSLFVMHYGDGAPTGSLTCLDVAAHEMSHGVMTFTANLSGGESQGLNEGNSDIHATMVKYYVWGADGTGPIVPDATTKAPGGHNRADYLWTLGSQLSKDGLTPTRWLYKPSKDGLSFDHWFDGMGMEDCHYSNGPANRAFYFLSQGAASDPTKETYSSYLPAGMTGIGNDNAIRIWYRAMSTVTDSSADYHAIREAVLAAATELHPPTGAADSPEVAAVKNAFAAINVGRAEVGQDPVLVTFKAVANSPFRNPNIVVAPALVPTPLPPPTVANAKNTEVTWDLGGLSARYPEGGKFVDGNFIAPVASNGAYWPVKAISKQDPRAYAVNMVFGVSLDCDSDTDTDACDMGALALAYNGIDVYPAAKLYDSIAGVDDVCLELFLEGFNNAFNH